MEVTLHRQGLRPQYAREPGSNRKSTKLTSDADAILTLKRNRPNDEFLSDILKHRHLEGVRETLQIAADHDGRVRCGYSLEAETGRVKCYTSPTGSGANLQTIQRTSGSTIVPMKVTISFNAILKAPMGGPLLLTVTD